MVEIVLTTLITGSPRGLGDDPELKVVRIIIRMTYLYTVTFGPSDYELHIDRDYVTVHVYSDSL